MSLNIEVGVRICECRNRANITQEMLADRAGVSTKTIIDYEHGKIPTLAKIVNALDALPITPPKLDTDAAACLDALARSRALEDPAVREIIQLLIRVAGDKT